jgi:beta-RFAP synthase
LGRWFGGIGAAAPSPSVVVSAAKSETLAVAGPDRRRAGKFARRFLEHCGLSGGARLSIERTIPAHVGLGSGTQLALAIGRSLAELHGLDPDPVELARAVRRAERSAIGTWTFAGGGLVVEGGRRRDGVDVAPLIARIPFPREWWCVVGVPDAAPGLSGESEARALRDLPAPDEREVARVSHLVLMGLLPALAEGDLDTFGHALSEVQSITGRWFAPIQGGAFASGPSELLVRAMKQWGVQGVGQSSWGPAVYGITSSEDAGRELAERVRDWIGDSGTVHDGSFRTEGARVWRDSAARRREPKIRAIRA